MKICMFTNTYKPHVGGVARSVDFFTTDLRAAGHRVLVVAPEFPEISDQEDEEKILRVPAIQQFNGSDFSVRLPSPLRVDQKMETFVPQLIHSHHPFLMGDTALRVARTRKVPLVFTHHTLYEQYTHYVPLDSEPMKRFVKHMATEYANFCNRVVAPSRSVADLIVRRGVNRPVDVVPTGVDLAFFAKGDGAQFRRDHQIPPDATVAGHLGRLAPEKNLNYLARATSRFMADRPDCRFLVVGEGPSREPVKTCFEQAGIAERLIMAGELSGQALADAYQAMDLFVFASKSETQGMVIAEAMAAGLAVIALDASGIREVVEDGVNGRLLSENADETEFAAAVADFFDQPQKARRWKEQAERTAGEYSRQNCVKKLQETYEAALEENIEESVTNIQNLSLYDGLLEKIKLEWDLISRKMSAAADAVRKEDAC